MNSTKRELPFRRYLAFSRASFLETLTFRASLLLSLGGSLIYTAVVCFLWKSIFNSAGTEIVNGMTYPMTLAYVAIAGAVTSSMTIYLVWDIGRDIQSGTIALWFVKPLDYFTMNLFNSVSVIVFSFFINVVPVFILVEILVGWQIPFGINILWFVLSVFLGVIINFCLDFMVGTICLHTQSIWGINIMKEVVVSVLSGVTVPLAFFPDALRQVMMFLPFQAVFNTPLTLMITPNPSTELLIRSFSIQIFWIIVLVIAAKSFFKVSSRVITINGG